MYLSVLKITRRKYYSWLLIKCLFYLLTTALAQGYLRWIYRHDDFRRSRYSFPDWLNWRSCIKVKSLGCRIWFVGLVDPCRAWIPILTFKMSMLCLKRLRFLKVHQLKKVFICCKYSFLSSVASNTKLIMNPPRAPCTSAANSLSVALRE